MTFTEAYTSLKQLYKRLMFPKSKVVGNTVVKPDKWTMAEIDQLDVHFFNELMNTEEHKNEVYLSQIW